MKLRAISHYDSYLVRLNEWTDQVRAFVRASEQERRGLIVPDELILYHKCKRSNVLPLEGGYLNQPSNLMLCFEIIEREEWEWEEEKAAMEKARQDINKALQERLAKK